MTRVFIRTRPLQHTLVGQAEASLRNLSAGKRAAPNDDRRRGGKSKIHGLRIFKSKGSGTLGYVYVASMEKWFCGLPNFYRKRKKIPTNPLTCFSAELQKNTMFFYASSHTKKRNISNQIWEKGTAEKCSTLPRHFHGKAVSQTCPKIIMPVIQNRQLFILIKHS